MSHEVRMLLQRLGNDITPYRNADLKEISWTESNGEMLNALDLLATISTFIESFITDDLTWHRTFTVVERTQIIEAVRELLGAIDALDLSVSAINSFRMQQSQVPAFANVDDELDHVTFLDMEKQIQREITNRIAATEQIKKQLSVTKKILLGKTD